MKKKTENIFSKWNELEPRKRRWLLFVFFLAAVIVTIISVHAYRINEYRKEIIRERKEYAAAIERVIAGSDAVMTEELLKELDGKVWNLFITDEELPAVNERYKVSNIARDGETVIARVIADSPDERWKRDAVRPNLEDLYLYLNGA